MRTISPQLQAHLAGGATTLATCWRLFRRDEVEMGFTDHSEDITFEGVDYLAATGFSPTSIQQRSDFSVDNMEVQGILNSAAITEADIYAGIYDYAELQVFMVNYQDISQGRMLLKTGWLGEVRVSRAQFIAEVRGIGQKLQQHFGRIITPACDAVLGDVRCKVNLASFRHSAEVTEAESPQDFLAADLTQENGWFAGGELQWLSGTNAGLRMEVKEFEGGRIVLVLPMPYAIEAGDTFQITAGCDKTAAACRNKFSNYVNFRGFPHIPGMDHLLTTAGTR